MAILKLRVDELPPLDDLNSRLQTVAEMNNMLEMMANTQSENIDDVNQTVSDLEMEIATLEMHNEDFVMAIEDANTKISTTEM